MPASAFRSICENEVIRIIHGGVACNIRYECKDTAKYHDIINFKRRLVLLGLSQNSAVHNVTQQELHVSILSQKHVQ